MNLLAPFDDRARMIELAVKVVLATDFRGHLGYFQPNPDGCLPCAQAIADIRAEFARLVRTQRP